MCNKNVSCDFKNIVHQRRNVILNEKACRLEYIEFHTNRLDTLNRIETIREFSDEEIKERECIIGILRNNHSELINLNRVSKAARIKYTQTVDTFHIQLRPNQPYNLDIYGVAFILTLFISKPDIISTKMVRSTNVTNFCRIINIIDNDPEDSDLDSEYNLDSESDLDSSME